ncbi:reverse transcriptase domain-containing protein [Bacillus sp. FJAT-27251]|uniref:reverse transcriptase domain-containing protein n=1 Tax=Bacillus sp. FJAT-27251 TaxID=1684142 RepID=UPI0006A79812|nr:reverse transcriptase domain-containing protein [Bacillus sp. FJAT-27251]
MNTLTELDKKFLSICQKERFKEEFALYKATKTDTLKEEPLINIQMGADGITHKIFEKQIDHNIDSIFNRLHRGNYYFYPFRELVKSKDPSIKSPYKALKLNKERILSIASIRDVIVQKVLYDFLYPKAEEKFKTLPLVSFGYRKNLNAPKAAKMVHSHLKDGFCYAIDGDIKKFFDQIPHNLLAKALKEFIGDSPLVYQLLYRFIHVDRIEWISYKDKIYKFKKERPTRTKRRAGIPQGGILSGLVANLYLHQFDQWVVNELGKSLPIRYVRYADDFVILIKEKEKLEQIKLECSQFLQSIGLELHSDEKKTKLIDLTQKGSFVNFVGFSISTTGIRIKKQNVQRFKERINTILGSTKLGTPKSMKVLKLRLDYKFFGNEMKRRVCNTCGKKEIRRNWLSFFLTITDVQQLKSLDKWVSQQIHNKHFLDTGTRLPRSAFKQGNFPCLEKIYYSYRKQKIKADSVCSCSPLEAEFENTRNPFVELFKY